MYVYIVDNLLATPYQNLGEHRIQISEIVLKDQCHEDSWCERNSPSLGITLKLRKFWNVAFNWSLYYDYVNKLKSSVYLSWRQLPQATRYWNLE